MSTEDVLPFLPEYPRAMTAGSRYTTGTIGTSTSVQSMRHKFEQYEKDLARPVATVPVMKRIEIWGPGEQLIYAARVPTPPTLKQKQPAYNILKINHEPQPREHRHKSSSCSQRQTKSSPGKLEQNADSVVKSKTETENGEYGSTRVPLSSLDALDNNVMNSGAIFGRIVKPEKNLSIREEAISSNIFDNRPLLPTVYPEREKKHFPHLTNKETNTKYKPRGRRYIPHGYGDDYEYRPHAQNIDVEYSECGPDWKSRIRWIPSPHNKDYPAAENWPTPWKSVRTYPWGVSGKTEKEWKLFPEGYNSTLRSTWGGVHKATEVTDREVTDAMLFGKGRSVVDKRNNIPMAAPGDKSYQVVEYSPEFYKYGSTLPVVNFGGASSLKTETIIPLTELPPVSRENYACKERRRRTAEEVDTVRSLERWRPATPLQAPNQSTTIPERTQLSVNSKY